MSKQAGPLDLHMDRCNYSHKNEKLLEGPKQKSNILEDDNLSWWFNVDDRLERQRNSEKTKTKTTDLPRKGGVWGAV